MLLFIFVIWVIGLSGSEFQYISCYSLSHTTQRRAWLQQPFQYISCYSLSIPASTSCSTCCSFNTSHVTLYLLRFHSVISLNIVSIHLMLLFIGEFLSEWDRTDAFQYISCYSLSVNYMDEDIKEQGFNTSHVTLYQRSEDGTKPLWRVSIHLMLLFIETAKAETYRAM